VGNSIRPAFGGKGDEGNLPLLGQLSATVLITCVLVIVVVAPAFAYSHDAAKQYAYQWALSYNVDFVHFSSDCANFVSQCLYAGSYPFTGAFNNNNSSWWYNWPGYPYVGSSDTWRLAANLRQFLVADYPGGWLWFEYHGVAPPQSMNLWAGDVVFYDFDANDIPDHAALKVGEGYDPNSWPSGSLVDAHNNNRYRAIWHLRPYNNYQWAHRYWGYHVDTAN